MLGIFYDVVGIIDEGKVGVRERLIILYFFYCPSFHQGHAVPGFILRFNGSLGVEWHNDVGCIVKALVN